MPWKDQSVMDQRLEFVLRALHERAPIAELCREYGISRKTGYKWMDRFQSGRERGLQNASRRPDRCPHALTEEVICRIVTLSQAHRLWGPKKIHALYDRLHGEAPSLSSFRRIFAKCHLGEPRRVRRRVEQTGRLCSPRQVLAPNDMWTVDFKGWWHSSDHRRCEPLTVRDASSRFLLCVRPLENARTETVQQQFELLFQRHGLPSVIRSDNGSPFASCRSPLGLSRLSAWWVALGVNLDRGEPGHPEYNGAHERMHRDLAAEVQYTQLGSLEELVAALELWRQSYNHERPHEALDMKTPAEVYVPSSRKYGGTPDQLEYPVGYFGRQVGQRGEICIGGGHILISTALQGWQVGLKPVDSSRYAVYFGRLCLGEVDLASQSFRCRRGVVTSSTDAEEVTGE